MFFPSFLKTVMCMAGTKMRAATRSTAHTLQVLHDFIFPPRKSYLLVREISYSFLCKRIQVNHSGNRTIFHTNIHNYLITSPFLYHDPSVQTLILEAKFHRNARAQQLLGKVLAQTILEVLREPKVNNQRLNVVLIPIPLGKKRRTQRGYNQVEEITCAALPYIKDSCNAAFAPEILIRTHETSPQMELGRQRRLKNVAGAFAVSSAYCPYIKNHLSYLYIVIDDVLTTGATLSAACEALTKAGAQNITAIALAH